LKKQENPEVQLKSRRQVSQHLYIHNFLFGEIQGSGGLGGIRRLSVEGSLLKVTVQLLIAIFILAVAG
jgi:hypothetical protein